MYVIYSSNPEFKKNNAFSLNGCFPWHARKDKIAETFR